MKRLAISLLAAMFAAGAFAADAAKPEPQTSANPVGQAKAEAKHLKKAHGTNAAASQPEVQMQANPTGQAKAEVKHLKKKHGNINDSADQRFEIAHPAH